MTLKLNILNVQLENFETYRSIQETEIHFKRAVRSLPLGIKKYRLKAGLILILLKLWGHRLCITIRMQIMPNWGPQCNDAVYPMVWRWSYKLHWQIPQQAQNQQDTLNNVICLNFFVRSGNVSICDSQLCVLCFWQLCLSLSLHNGAVVYRPKCVSEIICLAFLIVQWDLTIVH